MASFRVYKTHRLPDGSTYRESYSIWEYIGVKIIGGLFKLIWFTAPTYILLKIPYWTIHKILSFIPKTKKLSENLSNKNYWINEISVRNVILTFVLFPILVIMTSNNKTNKGKEVQKSKNDSVSRNLNIRTP